MPGFWEIWKFFWWKKLKEKDAEQKNLAEKLGLRCDKNFAEHFQGILSTGSEIFSYMGFFFGGGD